MPNGAAVTLPLELASTTISTPAKPTELEQRIGEAVAAAAAAVARAMADFSANGIMAPSTRTLGGDCLSRVALLQLAHFGELDFAAVARVAGKRALHQHHDTTLREANLEPAAFDLTFDE